MDDKGSMDLQIDEIKAFVSRHGFMEVAYRPEDLRNIVSSNKIAIVIGVEIDAIGNFHNGTKTVPLQMLKAEILRLHGKGVRYIFPIHIIDNKLGGTAVYEKRSISPTIENMASSGACRNRFLPIKSRTGTLLTVVLTSQ